MRVAVLGAGLQGACAALELAMTGVDVDLYDQRSECVLQASAQNEGKIHLGYVFGQDRTRRTARTMVRGALVFEELMGRWLGSDVERIPVSAPFVYAVQRSSLLTPDEVAAHLRASCEIARAMEGGRRRRYFGSDYRMAPEPVSRSQLAATFDTENVSAAFRTAEIAVDPEALAALVRARLAADDRINCRLSTRVRAVRPSPRGLVVHAEHGGQHVAEPYDHVVNALWESRLAVDATMNIAPERAWLFRIKHYLRLQAPAGAPHVPSTTIVLGPFGDIVTYRNGSVYLSWYPVGKLASSTAVEPPPWPLELGASRDAELRRGMVEGLADVVPGVTAVDAAAESCSVGGGIIFAWGQSDIDDPASGLHQRHAVGIHTVGSYHSVDTGKLTMAPLFGKLVADRIRRMGTGHRTGLTAPLGLLDPTGACADG